MKLKFVFGFLFFALVFSSFASAAAVSDVIADDLSPGQEGIIRVEVENILDKDITDVSLVLDFSGMPITPVGSSQSGVDEIEEGDEEDFGFRVKADNNAIPGDYQIPYTLSYDDGDEKTRTGSIGVSIKGSVEISYSVSSDDAIVGEEGRVNLKIINRGFADAKFVNVKIIASGFTLLSEDEVYIGNVDSDDFETASFDVIFNKKSASLVALITYKDFDNTNLEESVNLPLNVKTREEALELGLIEESNAPFYIGLVVVVIVLWFIYRSFKKRRRIKRSMEK